MKLRYDHEAVVIGAWTEDCVTATAFDASDRYGLDVIIVEDAVGTATGAHQKAIDVMKAACAKVPARSPSST